jgi:predicted adenylyl cyclase CyaB
MSKITSFEIKSRVPSCTKIESILEKNHAKFEGVDHQIDTYFKIDDGRLKLRQGNIENTLIFYKRDNTAKARESEIILEKLGQKTNLPQLLCRALGADIVVDKMRKIFFINNVKFDIDLVKGLGEFIEIEAISENGLYSNQELKEQCQKYIDVFELMEKDFMSLSYSDLINETFVERIERELRAFSKLLSANLPGFISVILKDVDHICYRASTFEEYTDLKREFSLLGSILVSAPVSGREITTYKLDNALSFCGKVTNILELAAPKKNNKYSTGFEHIEIVISDSFEGFITKNSNYSFDCAASKKSINPEIRYELSSGISIKFHHKPLEDVIEYEKKHGI